MSRAGAIDGTWRRHRLRGIAKAKAAGVYKGRKKSIDPARVRELQPAGLGATAIAERLGINRVSVYRALRARQAVPAQAA